MHLPLYYPEQLCSMGALFAVAENIPDDALYSLAVATLDLDPTTATWLENWKRAGLPRSPVHAIVRFNDNATSFSQIRAMFERAIELAGE